MSDPQLPDDPEGDRLYSSKVRETAIFSRCVASMLRTTQLDPQRVQVALRAQNDQVLAALRDALQPGASQAQRLLALVEVYMHATWEMLWQASRSPDRLEFAEAEIKAGAVARALDRAAEALKSGDDDMVVAAMMAAESVLGIHFTSP